MLIEREEYLACGVHIGMRGKTKDMRPYIYYIKKNKLSILDINKTDEQIRATGEYFGGFEPEKILLVARKENAHKPLQAFAQATGCSIITGRFLPGTLTNPSSPKFTEPDVVMISDPAEDHQAVIEAADANIPIVALADSANSTTHVKIVIPTNNKGKKALGIVYYLVARELLKAWKRIKTDEEFDFKPEDFTAE